MKKTTLGVLAGALALLTASCFTLQSFSVLATSVSAGGSTKAQFILHPATTTADKGYQFIVVGVPTGGDLKVGSAKWDTAGAFGATVTMPPSSSLPGAMATAGTCNSSGLAFSSVTGVKWKAFITPGQVRDKGLVDRQLTTQVSVKATAGAGTGTTYGIFGVTGKWFDDGDGVVNAADTFGCTGIATVGLYVKA